MDAATVVFLAVVGGRFALPLFIFKYPLPAIVACLVLDGVDQTIFQSFGYDPPGYQGYDKAMDVYYLALAYLAAMRNWTSPAAFAAAHFLYFYRLVGVLAFELTQWRPLLIVFPNTFEYFFIAYELLRLRWDPRRFDLRWWVGVAAVIWVVVKLPQEWWIHIARLDLTDEIAAHWWVLPVLALLVAVALVVVRRRVVPRLGPPDWGWRVAAEPTPVEIDTAAERTAWTATHARVWSWVTLEKAVLVGLLSVIFAQVLPGLRMSNLDLFLGLAVIVVFNAALSIWAAQRTNSVESIAVAFVIRLAVNIAIVLVSDSLLGRGDDVNRDASIFFVFLLSLLTVLHDRYWPVHEVRVTHARRAGGAPGRGACTAPASAP
jgi:hypothetical protein